MYRLVELAQDESRALMIRDNMHKIEPTLFGREITMPVADILRDEKDQNYTIAKKAFKSLAQKGVEYEDEKNLAIHEHNIKSKDKQDKRLCCVPSCRRYLALPFGLHKGLSKVRTYYCYGF